MTGKKGYEGGRKGREAEVVEGTIGEGRTA